MKTKNARSVLASALIIILIFVTMSTGVYAAEPRYIDLLSVYCSLDIANSVAECSARVIGKSNDNIYHITMVLYQDDNDYATWEASGTIVVNANETCYVTQGHEYYVGIYVAVYDPNGNFIEDVIAYTDIYYY